MQSAQSAFFERRCLAHHDATLRFGEEGRLATSCNVVGLSALRVLWNVTHRRGRRVAPISKSDDSMAQRLSVAVERVLYSHRIGIYRLTGKEPFRSETPTIPCAGLSSHSWITGSSWNRSARARAPRNVCGACGLSIDRRLSPRRYSPHFQPIEEIRILRGAYNIACCLWEFDQLNDRARVDNLDAPRQNA